MEETKSMTTKRILIFIGITFLITYGLEFGIIYPLSNRAETDFSGMTAILVQVVVAGMMFLPSIGVLLTRLITKEGFSDCWIKPRFRGHIRYYVMAWFLPALCTALGAVLYFAIFQKDFDGNLGYIISLYQAQGVTLDRSQAMMMALSQIIMGVFLAPLLNILTCFGEEWGWRGYLLPKMKEKLPLLPMLLVNGIIWGLWHAPLTILGHNYGLGYKGYPFIGPAPTGIVGGAFFLLLGIVLCLALVKDKSATQNIVEHE